MISVRRRIVGSYAVFALLLVLMVSQPETFPDQSTVSTWDVDVEDSILENDQDYKSESTAEDESEPEDLQTRFALLSDERLAQLDIPGKDWIGHSVINEDAVLDEEILEEAETEYDINCGKLKSFSNQSELEEYVRKNTEEVQSDLNLIYQIAGTPIVPGLALTGSDAGANLDYSGTNIQVEGVDEPDIVKTDGIFIYVLTGDDVVILRAYPTSMAEVISRTEVGHRAMEMFVNGNRLVVFQDFHEYLYVKVYDIANREEPNLIQNVSFEGIYLDARMIDNYVYVVVTEYVPPDPSNGIDLPTVTNNGNTRTVRPTEICHFDEPAPNYELALIVSIDLIDKDVRFKAYLIDRTRTMYVSMSNIYIAGMDYGDIQVFNWFFFIWNESTIIHKISIDEGSIQYVGKGKVPGWILNQFSMDEYESYFRIATTEGHAWTGSGSAANNVYVLTSEMETVGKLEGLGVGEDLYSVRFMATRAYLVTFKKIDPFFVVDLSNPTSPRLLGELKIPGFSQYLHPYDENHIIGLGMDALDTGVLAWNHGVKLSMFDVTDISDPKEISTYVIGHRGTRSCALHEHKAFLFSLSKNLLIIPIDLYEIDEDEYPDGVPPSASGNFIWQGAYVFSVTIEDGFVFKGRISHSDQFPDFEESSWKYRSYFVKRSLYIEDKIFTISDEMVKINDMDTLIEIKAIEL